MDPTTTSVTGVLVTGKTTDRYGMAKQAVAAWNAQNYPGPRQLLVINDHPTERLLTAAEMQGHIFEVRVRDGGNTLGHLRNIGTKLAQGDYVVQWDDDDYSHPERLTYQVTNTPEDGASIFRYEINCDVHTGEGFVNCGKQIRCKGFPGTMLYPRDTPCRFPDKGKAEDTEFVLDLADYSDLVVLDNPPEMYVRFYHGANTWHRAHVMTRKLGSRDLSPKQQEYLHTVLTKYEHSKPPLT